MRKHRKHRRRHSGERLPRIKIVWIGACVIAAYLITLFLIEHVGGYIENKNAAESFGSLEGRFEEPLTMDYAGRTYEYRRNDFENLLIIGVDRESMQGETTGVRSGGQADFMLLLAVDRENRRVTPIQLDRDTVSAVQVYGVFGDAAGTRDMQICLAYAFGDSPEAGCENTALAVSNLLGGVEIDHYIAMDMSGMAEFNDALGGIKVTLDEDFSDMDPAMTEGTTLTLHGEQAEIFLRSRMHVGDGTNRSRMARQRTFMDGAIEALVQGLNSDAGYAERLFDQMEAHMYTNTEQGKLASMMYSMSEYERSNIQTLTGTHRIGPDGFMEFHVDRDALTAQVVNTFFE